VLRVLESSERGLHHQGEAWMPTQLGHRGREGEDASHFMGWMIKLGLKSSSHQSLSGQGPRTQVPILIQQVYSKS
jgi:hypothetical protein